MAKTDMIRKKAAKEFAEFWKDRGDERQETARFWIGLLEKVLGMENPSEHIDFEKKVQLKHTSFIDAYIPETKVLIEQKSSDVDLRKEAKQSDGAMLTPYRQAKRYADEMPNSLRPNWIVVCNFKEFLIYDLEKPHDEPQQVLLENLPNDFHRLQFLVDTNNTNISREEAISLEAGRLDGKLYASLFKEYINPDEHSLKSLNILCVRIIFCLYAEDAGLFETKTAFEDYIRSFNLSDLRDGIIKLFKALNTKLEDRDKYDLKLKPFPYVNGGLFADQNIEIPNFTEEIVDVIVNQCAPFNWSKISPTIFGAVFESTLNPETRKNGGMHYTSIENIHKVIDPLFLNDLKSEFEEICKLGKKAKIEALAKFQKKLGALKFLDPACGSGNFLTETYLSLRRLENKVIEILYNSQDSGGSKLIAFDNLISVKISQFYGIEINDFAVDVAKTSLWIAESQMIKETEEIVAHEFEFLPLSTSATIVEGNALRINWATLKNEEVPTVYDYVIGNPPFVGARLMNEEQKDKKEDVIFTFGKDWHGVGNLDYVCCWYKKALDTIKNSLTRCAFVSTDSVSQGVTVTDLWKPLFESGLHIDFAWKPFKWANETTDKGNMAAVHCVIVGFSEAENKKEKYIFLNKQEMIIANNINGYLNDGPNMFINSSRKPLSVAPKMGMGNQPIDDGLYLFTDSEKIDFLKKEPSAENYFHKWLDAKNFINGVHLWCLWLGECSPAQLRKMPNCLSRVQAVQKYRSQSTRAATLKLAEKPTRFQTENMPKLEYLVIPEVSSELRQYIPIGFVTPDVLCSNKLRLIPNATHYHFGILTSNVHNAWIRTIGGRRGTSIDYSINMVYNTFPWCEPNEAQKAKIEKTAQQILDIRAKYPDCSLADLYDQTTMPADLRKAHIENDKAVMAAYGFKSKISEAEIVAELFKMYEKLTK